jgi:hypothetical protein
MFQVFLLITIFSAIVWYEAPALVRKKQWREFISFSVILGLGFALCLLQILEIKLPNPSRIIAAIFNIKY